MLYKFKSKVTSDVIMLEPNGREILQIIGKFSAENPHKGIIEPQDIPMAIQMLDKAIAKADFDKGKTPQSEEQDGTDSELNHTIQLRQRAAPFLDLLKRSLAQQQPIVWGV